MIVVYRVPYVGLSEAFGKFCGAYEIPGWHALWALTRILNVITYRANKLCCRAAAQLPLYIMTFL